MDDDSRHGLCQQIKNKMLELEKYSTSAEKTKKTYMMIPANHPVYPFPYNLEDRAEFIVAYDYMIPLNYDDVVCFQKSEFKVVEKKFFTEIGVLRIYIKGNF